MPEIHELRLLHDLLGKVARHRSPFICEIRKNLSDRMSDKEMWKERKKRIFFLYKKTRSSLYLLSKLFFSRTGNNGVSDFRVCKQCSIRTSCATNVCVCIFENHVYITAIAVHSIPMFIHLVVYVRTRAFTSPRPLILYTIILYTIYPFVYNFRSARSRKTGSYQSRGKKVDDDPLATFARLRKIP